MRLRAAGAWWGRRCWRRRVTVTVSDFQAAGDALPSPLGNLTFKADLEMERDPGALLKRKKTSGQDGKTEEKMADQHGELCPFSNAVSYTHLVS